MIGQEFFEVERVQDHSPLISGTFTMEIAQQTIQHNNSPNLPYDISADALQTAIRAIPALSRFRVERANNPLYGATWFIHHDHYYGSLPEPDFTIGDLTGGK